jgi:hypothetical protein
VVLVVDLERRARMYWDVDRYATQAAVDVKVGEVHHRCASIRLKLLGRSV